MVLCLRYILSYAKKWPHLKPFVFRNRFRNLCRETKDITIKYSSIVKSVRVVKLLSKCNFYILGVATVTSLLNENEPLEDVKNNLNYLIEKANDAMAMGNYTQAEEVLKFSLTIAKKYSLRGSWENICHKLVNVSIIRKDLKNAETLLLNAVEQLNNWEYEADSNSTVEFLLRLAQIYSVTDNDTLAKTGFDNCLRKQQAKIANGKIDERTGLLYIGILLSYSAHLVKHEMYEDARKFINTAQQYMNYIPNLTLSDELALSEALADLNTDFGALKHAADHLVSAIVIAKLLHSATLTMYNNRLLDIFEME